MVKSEWLIFRCTLTPIESFEYKKSLAVTLTTNDFINIIKESVLFHNS
jgi:hypothetical protein